jgi:hypothetical protein
MPALCVDIWFREVGSDEILIRLCYYPPCAHSENGQRSSPATARASSRTAAEAPSHQPLHGMTHSGKSHSPRSIAHHMSPQDMGWPCRNAPFVVPMRGLVTEKGAARHSTAASEKHGMAAPSLSPFPTHQDLEGHRRWRRCLGGGRFLWPGGDRRKQKGSVHCHPAF